MKKTQASIKHELQAMTVEQLHEAHEQVRRQLFELRLKAATGHVKAFSSIQKTLKKTVARILTFTRQKQVALKA